MERKQTAIVVFKDIEVLDFTGPFEVFAVTRLNESKRREEPSPFNVFLVAETKDPVVTAGGMKVLPDYDLADCPPLDILVVPGGWGARREMNNERLLGWIAERAKEVETLASVCTGALLLGKAGLLDGRRATTHWRSLDWMQELFPKTRVEKQRHFVDEGALFTSAGISAGIDMSLKIVARHFGDAVARAAAEQMEYPFPESDARRVRGLCQDRLRPISAGDRKETVGFIGIGKMGLPMANRIAAQGYPLHVYDISEAALEAICKQTAAQAQRTLKEIGRNCNIVILMLPDSEVVKRVLFGEKEGLAAHLSRGSIVIDMSSSNPSVTREIGPRLREAGVDFIDAPVSGGVRRAVDGSLAIMAGGDSAAIARVKPLLLTMGKTIIETGILGSGHAMKALNNYVSAAGLLAACEALKVGSDFGIAPDKIVAVLNASTGKNNSTENKLMQFIVSNLFNSGFSLGLMRKDIHIAVDLAKSTGSRTLLGEVLLKSWADAEARLGGVADHTEIFRMLDP